LQTRNNKVPNVVQFKTAVERRAARIKKEKETEKSDEPPDGVIQFTSTSRGDLMSITGTYASRLQNAAFAMIKGLNDIADRIAESGNAGSFSSGPVKGVIQAPRQRETPRRLRETTGFSELR
jgi:hypothetical protein